jgi:hypothetical protein
VRLCLDGSWHDPLLRERHDAGGRRLAERLD